MQSHLHLDVCESFLKGLLRLFSPGPDLPLKDIEQLDQQVKNDLSSALAFLGPDSAKDLAQRFWAEAPNIFELLMTDAKAINDGDPASTGVDEVILTYPGYKAIVVHRVAHFFYKSGIQIFPRALSELCHGWTGIDIHPGATIGESFCIDHGTGIVIGETSVIGRNVKIYQGVTLGGLSVKKELASKKRHPTIEDRVVIYASATILGGNTVVGHDSIVGGNVWLNRSVPPFSAVLFKGDPVIQDLRAPSTGLTWEI